MTTSTHAPSATGSHDRPSARPTPESDPADPRAHRRPGPSLAGEVGQSVVLLGLAAVAAGSAVGVHALLQALA